MDTHDNKKTDDLLFIERCFTAIKMKVDVAGNLKKIDRTLERLFDMKFSCHTINNKTNEFVGMSVFPAVSTMDVLVDSILNKKSSSEEISKIWTSNKEWYIEIDSILLWDDKLAANPAEITSVLLHEIGHTVYSNTIPQRLNRIFRYKLMKMTYQMRQLTVSPKIRKLFNLAIIEGCSTKSYSHININKERDADKFVLYYGYGEDLDSFINKLIKSQGTSAVNRTDDDQERDITIIVNWTVNNINELEFRKKSLKTSLRTEMLKTPSDLTKKVIQDIHDAFFGEATDKYRELLSEQYMSNPHDVVAEMESYQILDKYVQRILTEASGNIFDKNGKLKKITQADVDILTVEAERIDNTDDKIYLLDKLYAQLELINLGLDYIEAGHKDMNVRVTQSKSTLLSMRNQLEDLREQIIATKILDKSYGTFIRFPKGYQG